MMRDCALRRYPLLISLLMGWIAAGGCFAAQETPYRPSSDDVVLQTVPSISDPRVRAFDALRSEQAGRPGDMALAVKLSMAYLDYARGTGDARYLGRAAAVITPWMSRRPVPVLLVHATILQSKHYFADARAELMEILRREHENVQAWLTLATVAQVQGDFTTARQSCRYLLSASQFLVPLVCLSSLNAVTGRAASATRVLTALWPQMQAQPAAVQAWMQGIMADAAKYAGDAPAADQHYRTALQLAPGDNFLLADYGDFLLDEKRPQAALDLVKDYTASDTSFLRQVFAEMALHSPRANADAQAMALRFAAIDRRGSRTYRREEAEFALYSQHDPQRALQLATRNWTVQRAPEDMRVLLAAALAAHEPQAAQPALDQLARSHFEYAVVIQLASRVKRALASKAPTLAGMPAARAPAVAPVASHGRSAVKRRSP